MGKKNTRQTHRQPKTLCKKCGLPIAFKKLANGKFCPINPDGSDHWDLCKQTVRGARPFDRDMKSSAIIVGSKFVELPPLSEGKAPWD